MILLALVLTGLSFCQSIEAADLSAQVAVSSQEVYLGEPFTVQIQITGSDNPTEPDLSEITDFTIQKLGGQQNSSQSVTIINGRMSQVSRLGYNFTYQFTPTRSGSLTIPSFLIRVNGQTAQTQPVRVLAKQPQETEDFKLRMKLSKETCYVGEPIRLDVTWYLRKDVRDFNFTLPALSNRAFSVATPPVDTSIGGPYYRINVGSDGAIGEKGQGKLDGKDYATISFSMILIPRTPGSFHLEPAVVSCEALAGYRHSRSALDSFFNDDFFSDFLQDDFFNRRRGVYEKAVVPSNSLDLDVKPLPNEKRPVHFADHVGQYRITATASPTSVSVGEPITLTISLDGPEYLEHVSPPALSRQGSLSRDFKIPAEMAGGKLDGRRKTFTQTIRALHSDIEEIPPIELPYFDTDAGEYRVARSEAIPISVRESRVVTASDAEGLEPVLTPSRLESWTDGIAHNYEGPELLRDQRSGVRTWLTSPLWTAPIVIPPIVYFSLLAATYISKRRDSNPALQRARNAYSNLKSQLNVKGTERTSSEHDVVLEALRQFLGDRLSLPSKSLTLKEVETILSTQSIPRSDIAALRDLFRTCEAGRYAGGTVTESSGNLTDRCLQLCKKLDQLIQ